MSRQKATGEATGCDRCPAFMPGKGSVVCVSGFSVIPSRMVAQVTDGIWNAVVTTLDKGTFLIRRSKDLPANACPLRAFEIRHVAADLPPVRKRAGGEGHAWMESCRNLPVQGRMEPSSAINV